MRTELRRLLRRRTELRRLLRRRTVEEGGWGRCG